MKKFSNLYKSLVCVAIIMLIPIINIMVQYAENRGENYNKKTDVVSSTMAIYTQTNLNVPTSQPPTLSPTLNTPNKTIKVDSTLMPNDKIQKRLDKIEAMEDKEKKKRFMLIIAQDDLECFTWGEKSQYSNLWKIEYQNNNYNGNDVLQVLQFDLDTYLSFGSSQHEVIWETAGLLYDLYKSGNLKAKMTESEYQKFINNLKAVEKRLGILFGKREFAPN